MRQMLKPANVHLCLCKCLSPRLATTAAQALRSIFVPRFLASTTSMYGTAGSFFPRVIGLGIAVAAVLAAAAKPPAGVKSEHMGGQRLVTIIPARADRSDGNIIATEAVDRKFSIFVCFCWTRLHADAHHGSAPILQGRLYRTHTVI